MTETPPLPPPVDLAAQAIAVREAYEERAAVMQYEGGLPREEAEAEARRLTGYEGWQ